ncbi:hypothetical protein DAPPUDRAFT_330832 [Daphnia pulex]|uniref:Uncharacterized protein n=1 Tax=Daphnia pulex TaxID=6669 RepID=E9HKR7_DAPPU|nr:hypothetical protein DAPPUDRAFT_330832 [Daphnia pulex]|eukprot:EFX67653.1 hypothetical protein DAPPUDRAFT_330832 [Daphnia pulex]
MQRYHLMKSAVSQNPNIMEKSGLVLFQINKTTLSNWYKNSACVEEVKLLLQITELPDSNLCSKSPLLAHSIQFHQSIPLLLKSK